MTAPTAATVGAMTAATLISLAAAAAAAAKDDDADGAVKGTDAPLLLALVRLAAMARGALPPARAAAAVVALGAASGAASTRRRVMGSAWDSPRRHEIIEMSFAQTCNAKAIYEKHGHTIFRLGDEWY